MDNLISLIDYSNNLIIVVFALIQTGILIASFILGTKYLRQHKQKLLAENKNRLVDRCIRISHELTTAYSQLLHIPFEEYEELTDKESPELAEKLRKDFFNKYHEHQPLIETLKSELEINISLIKDKKIQICHREFREAITMMLGSYVSFHENQIDHKKFIEIVPNRLRLSNSYQSSEYMRTRRNFLEALYASYHNL